MSNQLTSYKAMLDSKLSRMGESQIKIHRIVEAKPGIRLSDIARVARFPSAASVRYHINRLKKAGLVTEIKDGQFTRFFVVGGDHDYALDLIIARFARPVMHKIGELLLEQPMYSRELSESIGVPEPNLWYFLKRMMEQGDVQRRREHSPWLYSLTNPGLVSKAFAISDSEKSSGIAPS